MTRTEDLLRAATQRAAAQIHSDSITPLDPATLAAPRRRDGSYQAARFPRHRPKFAGPLAAAAAVTAVIGLSIGVHSALGGRVVASNSDVPGSSGNGPGASSGTVPVYYAALTGITQPWVAHPFDITVRSTMTGSVLATVAPPSGYGTFGMVAPGQNDDEFIVGAQPWQPASNSHYTDNNDSAPVTLLMLHFDPATHAVSFGPLPGPKVSLSGLDGVALSPDGTQLAVAAQVSPDELGLDVYSLTGGGVRTWSLSGAEASRGFFGTNGMGGMDTLSWRPDGKDLAFDWAASDGSVSEVRLLDTSQPGGSLLADSRAIFALSPVPVGGHFLCTDVLIPSPDGTTLTCAGRLWPTLPPALKPNPTATPTPSPIPTTSPQDLVSERTTYGIGQYSAATGKFVTIIDPTVDRSNMGVNQQVFWTGSSSLIGTLDGPVFVLQGGRVHDIPWSSNISPAAGGVNDAAW